MSAKDLFQRFAASSRALQIVAMTFVLLVAMVIALSQLVSSQQRLSGNNGVSPDAFISIMSSSSDPLCVQGVDLPPDSAGIRLFLGTYHRSDQQISLTAFDAAGDELGRATSAKFDDGDRVFVPVPTKQKNDLTLCVTPLDGRIAVPGSPNGNANIDQVSMLGDSPVEGDISIEYMRAGSESLVSTVGTVFDRAALFRPAWIGAWTYYLAFLCFLLVIAFAWWLLVKRSGDRGGRLRPLIIAVAAIAFFNAVGWAVVTPAFNTPDEFSHFTYVETLSRGELPDKELAPDDAGNSYLASLVYVSEVTARPIIGKPFVKLPWSQAAEDKMYENYEAIRDTNDSAYGLTPARGYSPVYYAPAVIAYELGGVGNVFDRLFFIRLYSALFFALAVVFAMLFARELFPRTTWAPLVAGLAVAFEPMAAHISGGASNDSMMMATCTAALYFGARILRRGPTFRDAFAMATAFALAVAAKPTSAGIVVALLLVALVSAIRSDERLRTLFVFVKASIVPVIALALVQLQFGAGASEAGTIATTAGERPASLTGFLSYVWQWYLPSIGSMDEYFVGTPPAFKAFIGGAFADFNALDTRFPDGVYYAAFAALLGLCLLALRAIWLRRDRMHEIWPFVAYASLALVGVALFVNSTGYFLFIQDGQLFAQGRYLFPAIAVFGALIVAGALGSGRRLALPLASACVIALACTNLFGMAISLSRFYL